MGLLLGILYTHSFYVELFQAKVIREVDWQGTRRTRDRHMRNLFQPVLLYIFFTVFFFSFEYWNEFHVSNNCLFLCDFINDVCDLLFYLK